MAAFLVNSSIHFRLGRLLINAVFTSAIIASACKYIYKLSLVKKGESLGIMRGTQVNVRTLILIPYCECRL